PDRHAAREPASRRGRQERLESAFFPEGIESGGAEDRAAARQDAGDRPPVEREHFALGEAAPALADADDVVPSRVESTHDRADGGVETGAVAPAGEDAGGAQGRRSVLRSAVN